MSGHQACDSEPMDLQQQRMDYPEYRYWEHVREHETCNVPSTQGGIHPSSQLPILALNEVFIGESLSARWVAAKLVLHRELCLRGDGYIYIHISYNITAVVNRL